MEIEDIITLLLVIGFVMVFTGIGGDIYFETGPIKYIGPAGTAVILFVAIIILQQLKRKKQRARTN